MHTQPQQLLRFSLTPIVACHTLSKGRQYATIGVNEIIITRKRWMYVGFLEKFIIFYRLGKQTQKINIFLVVEPPRSGSGS